MCLLVSNYPATMPNTISLCNHIVPLCCGMCGEVKRKIRTFQVKDTYLLVVRLRLLEGSSRCSKCLILYRLMVS